jgi:Family of unknown function (DUF5995)
MRPSPGNAQPIGSDPSTVAEVIERLRALADASPTDGVSAFARLYLAVTEGVQANLARATFEDPAFLTRLDVVFASLFFDALDAYARDPGSAPRAWVPLFEQRSQRRIAPLQFALAGMNAHINRDLPVALVSTSTELGVDLRVDSPEHTDFEAVNALLEQTEARVKTQFLTGWVRVVDRLLHPFGRLDDVAAMWDIRVARDAAWANGETLWALRDTPRLSSDFLRTLDRTVGLASRGLLVPTQNRIQGLARRLFPALSPIANRQA